jgi:hypothetical protein
VRDDWLSSEDALLADCEVDTYRASGPGGQKRNKTDSAVRLRHRPSGISVIASESRSQAENRARALQRLQTALALKLRQPVALEGIPASIGAGLDRKGRLDLGRRDRRYLAAAATLLDLLQAHQASLSLAAAQLGLTTGNLSSFLTGDDDLLAEANRIRAAFGVRPLRRSS